MRNRHKILKKRKDYLGSFECYSLPGHFWSCPKWCLQGAGHHYSQVPDGEAERLSELPQATHFISRPQVPIWDYLCKFLTLCTTNKSFQGKTHHVASAVCIVWETLLSGADLLGCHIYLLGYPAGVHLQLPLITRVDIVFIQQQEQEDHSTNKSWMGPRSSRSLARLRHVICKHIMKNNLSSLSFVRMSLLGRKEGRTGVGGKRVEGGRERKWLNGIIQSFWWNENEVLNFICFLLTS